MSEQHPFSNGEIPWPATDTLRTFWSGLVRSGDVAALAPTNGKGDE